MVKKAAAIRILICMTALTLVGVTALARGSKSGFITVNGSRMTIAMRGPSKFVTPMERDEPGLKTIYSNLGTGNSVYNCCTGWTISALGSLIGAQNWIGEAFTPTADATVTRIKVADGYVTGTNGGVIALAADKNNVPGKILKSWGKINLPAFGTCCTLKVGQDNVGGIPVKAGVQYWVVVKTGPNTSDTWDAFNLDNSATGPLANNTGSGWNNLGVNQQGAFAVLGN
jgi:hypothetical protein